MPIDRLIFLFSCDTMIISKKGDQMEIKFRPLRADEIECRVGMITDKTLTLLLYKDSRADMDLLDETVGPLNWKREHLRDNRNCIVSIWDGEKHEWVGKEDTGTESRTEAEKGLASDSFKRACVNWGIGRELYTGPRIKLYASRGQYKPDGRKTDDKFKVVAIEYDGLKQIIKLAIKNITQNKIVFQWGFGEEQDEIVNGIKESILRAQQARQDIINAIKEES